VPFLHGIRDAVIKDRRSSRDDRKIGPGTILNEEPLKDRSSRRDIGRSRKRQRNKGPRRKTAATSEEGENNRRRHQGRETGATSGKQEDIM
jgi:hypothetical protein